MLKYRSDIDGLRAVAVLSVFAFHLSPFRFPAGGIGVDVFLVISGYLIGGILLRETAEGSFSLARFYERRVRRIAPALLVVLAFSTVAGLALQFPDDLIALARSAIASILSLANFEFWQTTNYFNHRAAEVPLLHMWSLGVEEQFYLAAPFVIIAVHRYARSHLRLALTVMCLMSFALSVRQVDHSPTTAFYLPLGRGWELLIGVLLNLYPLKFAHVRRWREAAAWAGSIGLGLSFIFIRPAQGFPGFAALLPCISTALIIGAGQQGPTLVSRLLSLRPVLFVGLISYSLYLWHWPAIVFVKEYLTVMNMPVRAMVAIVILAFVPAILSWRFVERPFRSKHMSRRTVYAITGSAAIALIALNVAIIMQDGLPGRIPAAALRMARFSDSYQRSPVNFDRCFVASEEPASSFDKECLQARSSGPSALLLGDSHAAMYRYALGKAIGAPILQATAAGCQVETAALGKGKGACAEILKRGVEQVETNPSIRAVFLSSRWENLNTTDLGELLARLGRRTTVYLIGPVPEFDAPVGKLLAVGLLKRDPDIVNRHILPNYRRVESSLVAISRQHGAVYLSPASWLCRPVCIAEWKGEPAYFDNNHLTDAVAFAAIRDLVPRSGWFDRSATLPQK